MELLILINLAVGFLCWNVVLIEFFTTKSKFWIPFMALSAIVNFSIAIIHLYKFIP